MNVFRQPGFQEIPAKEWDVFNYLGEARISFRSDKGEHFISSPILDHQGCAVKADEIGRLGTLTCGTKLQVKSGKTYILTGYKVPFPYNPNLSLLKAFDPKTKKASWLVRLFRLLAGSVFRDARMP